jgi:hypothetical protein
MLATPLLRFVKDTLPDSLETGNSKKEEKQKRLGLDKLGRIT